jgi:hypothetical protein
MRSAAGRRGGRLRVNGVGERLVHRAITGFGLEMMKSGAPTTGRRSLLKIGGSAIMSLHCERQSLESARLRPQNRTTLF